MALPKNVRFKATDIWQTPDDGKRYEVIDGELYMSPPPGELHQKGLGNLYGLLWSHIRPRKLGKVYPAPFGVVLDDENGLQPDIVYVSREWADIVSERGVFGAPDLVVEVFSPSTRARDRGIKLRRYAAAGVPHYWTLDPRRKTLEARELTAGGYELAGLFGPGTVFHPALFPGLQIPIDDLWE